MKKRTKSEIRDEEEDANPRRRPAKKRKVADLPRWVSATHDSGPPLSRPVHTADEIRHVIDVSFLIWSVVVPREFCIVPRRTWNATDRVLMVYGSGADDLCVVGEAFFPLTNLVVDRIQRCGMLDLAVVFRSIIARDYVKMMRQFVERLWPGIGGGFNSFWSKWNSGEAAYAFCSKYKDVVNHLCAKTGTPLDVIIRADVPIHACKAGDIETIKWVTADVVLHSKCHCERCETMKCAFESTCGKSDRRAMALWFRTRFDLCGPACRNFVRSGLRKVCRGSDIKRALWFTHEFRVTKEELLKWTKAYWSTCRQKTAMKMFDALFDALGIKPGDVMGDPATAVRFWNGVKRGATLRTWAFERLKMNPVEWTDYKQVRANLACRWGKSIRCDDASAAEKRTLAMRITIMAKSEIARMQQENIRSVFLST